MRIDYELSWLKYFYQVAQTGSFTKAAAVLSVQQPSITRGVKNLEAQLGVKLFERSGKKVKLTVAGKRVLESCEKIFAEAKNILQIAEAETSGCTGPFKFGASAPISTYLVPEILKTYLEKFPETWPMMYAATGEELIRKIQQGELEFGLFLHLPEILPELEKRNLAKYRFRIVVGKKWKNNRSVKARFIGSREIEENQVKKFPALERLKKEIPEAKIAISTNDISAHREMVLNGLGVAILPEFMIGEGLVDLYPDEEFYFPLVLVTRRNGVLSRAAKEFLKLGN